MGVIKDGTVSGFLPSSQAFAVHYPGYPSSMSRAVETLGGTQGIDKVFIILFGLRLTLSLIEFNALLYIYSVSVSNYSHIY